MTPTSDPDAPDSGRVGDPRASPGVTSLASPRVLDWRSGTKKKRKARSVGQIPDLQRSAFQRYIVLTRLEVATVHTTPRECFRDVSTGAAMMSLAASVASPVPARVQRRARPHAVANARATALGAGWAHGGSSARALKARARVTAPRRATAAPAQAKTLEERIASGEFTQSTESPLLWGLNNLRDTIKNVAPQSTCLILRRARHATRRAKTAAERFDRVFPTRVPRARCLSARVVAHRFFYAAPHAAARSFLAPDAPPARRPSRAPR